MKLTTATTQRIVTIIASRHFFWLIVLLLVFQALWIALSGKYPMAFDEDFHLGIIRLYSHHALPFWQSQPDGTYAFGAFTRDPSYLYHYLMSFPFRLVQLVIAPQAAQVISLRLINIGLFASGLYLFRRVLMTSKASPALVHSCLAVFVLIPIVPLLAAQINYDNLLFPAVALVLLVTVAWYQQLRRDNSFNIKLFGGLVVGCLLTSLIKYAFLPIAFGIGLFVVIAVISHYKSFVVFRQSLRNSIRALSTAQSILLVILMLVSLGLWTERYGVNLLRYHNPVPDCSKVLTVSQCSVYAPWIRDYDLAQNNLDHDSPSSKSVLVFGKEWLFGMWLRSFFAVDGPSSNFQTRGPLILPGMIAVFSLSIGLIALLVSHRRVFATYQASVLGLFMVVITCYIGSLLLDEFHAFLKTGQPVAINGRYLLPVILPILLLVGLGLTQALRRWQLLKLILLLTTLICLTWGGGALTFILRSNDHWYWDNSTVRRVNHAIKQTLGPITPGYKTPTKFLP